MSLHCYCAEWLHLLKSETSFDSTSGSDSEQPGKFKLPHNSITKINVRLHAGLQPDTPPFEVTFSIPVESRYSQSVSFRSLNQQGLLAHMWDDEIRVLDVRSEIDSAPDQNFLFQENPLELGGYYLKAIRVKYGALIAIQPN